MVNQEPTNETTQKPRALRVYRKDSKFKEHRYWYSATRSDGINLNVIFKEGIEVPDLKAFEIRNVYGQLEEKTVIKNGETYTNYNYYVSRCDFQEIEGEELPL